MVKNLWKGFFWERRILTPRNKWWALGRKLINGKGQPIPLLIGLVAKNPRVNCLKEKNYSLGMKPRV